MAVIKEVSPSDFLFFFLFLSLHTPHFPIQSFVSRRICSSSFASEVDLGQRQCIGVPKSVKSLSGFEQDFKMKNLSSNGAGWALLDFPGFC